MCSSMYGVFEPPSYFNISWWEGSVGCFYFITNSIIHFHNICSLPLCCLYCDYVTSCLFFYTSDFIIRIFSRTASNNYIYTADMHYINDKFICYVTWLANNDWITQFTLLSSLQAYMYDNTILLVCTQSLTNTHSTDETFEYAFYFTNNHKRIFFFKLLNLSLIDHWPFTSIGCIVITTVVRREELWSGYLLDY